MRWLASRYGDADLHEELGILTAEVRARKASQEALMRGDTAGPAAQPSGGEEAGEGGSGGEAAGQGGGNGGGREGRNGENGGTKGGGAQGGRAAGGKRAEARTAGGSGAAQAGGGGEAKPPTAALTDEPPSIPARLHGLELGPACAMCGGMMQRTGSCYTCSSCGNNTGCG
jgi:ribonucleoside-diphosphate reductase alpha chain